MVNYQPMENKQKHQAIYYKHIEQTYIIAG